MFGVQHAVMRWVMIGVLLPASLAGCVPRGRVVVSALPPQPFCTRTLGVAECFADPAALLDRPTPIGDTPVRTHVACEPVWREGGLACWWGETPRP